MEDKDIISVTLVEPVSSGHHLDYLLHTISEFSANNIRVHFVGCPELCDKIIEQVESVFPLSLEVGCNVFLREMRRYQFCKQVFKLAKEHKSDLIHFLYIDRMIRALAFCQNKNNLPVISTLHWAYMLPVFASSRKQKVLAFVERYFLNKLLNLDMKLIVHSDYLAREFNCVKANSTLAVNYPVSSIHQFSEKGREKIRGKLALEDNHKLLLCFGGTRFDKGADLAVEMLEKLPEHYHLLVAGKEEEIKYTDLNLVAAGYKDRLHTMNRFIDDKEVNDIFSAADTVLLPYREHFAGQSGPLTIAASLGIPVLASDIPVLSETIIKYQLGEVVNIKSLSLDKLAEMDLFSNNTSRFIKDSSVAILSSVYSSVYIEVGGKY